MAAQCVFRSWSSPRARAALALVALAVPSWQAGHSQDRVASGSAVTILAGVPLVAASAGNTGRLVADASDGRLDDFDLVAAALVASGVEDPCELATWLGHYAQRRADVLSQAQRQQDAAPLVALHAALHEQILVGRYRSAASDLRRALARGEYNCLSSAVLYVDLCREAGHELELWAQPGHVFVSTMAATGQRIEPGARRWQPAASALPAADRPAGANRDEFTAARPISPVALLGRVYYNRGLELLAKRDYAAGLALVQVSLALDPADRDARQNLLAGINNWAVECCRQQRYRDAAALIQQGLRLEPTFLPLCANERYVKLKLAD